MHSRHHRADWRQHGQEWEQEKKELHRRQRCRKQKPDMTTHWPTATSIGYPCSVVEPSLQRQPHHQVALGKQPNRSAKARPTLSLQGTPSVKQCLSRGASSKLQMVSEMGSSTPSSFHATPVKAKKPSRCDFPTLAQVRQYPLSAELVRSEISSCAFHAKPHPPASLAKMRRSTASCSTTASCPGLAVTRPAACHAVFGAVFVLAKFQQKHQAPRAHQGASSGSVA